MAFSRPIEARAALASAEFDAHPDGGFPARNASSSWMAAVSFLSASWCCGSAGSSPSRPIACWSEAVPKVSLSLPFSSSPWNVRSPASTVAYGRALRKVR
ncbi:hypothetical protein AB0M50_46800 [Nonomuraea fuscirosea]|jgi:hypothetical protein|uniref:hypothetical protein n=1 Tax=Nonomuraea fuscirosea TaxID=1291556 RepID=UPI0034495E8E